ncbi:MAG: alpha/beta hydrolase [Saprospiraceae bacterium]|nr:alpha/beta hydrolase [Saprospiraceae bacterium]
MSRIQSIRDRYVEVEGASLYVKTIGDSPKSDQPALVFLHDALGSVAQWKDFPEHLSRKTGLPTILYDRHGHGRSEKFLRERTADYLHREALEILPALLEKMKINRPLLVGHSDGGSIALIYAAHHQPVALISEAAHIFVEDITLKGIEVAAQHRNRLVEKLEKYHGEKTEALFAAWADTWQNESFRQWNIMKELPKITCPSLLIQGIDDNYGTLSQIETIKEKVRGPSRLFVPENCEHIPHHQAREQVLHEMTAFIRKLLK